MPQPDFYLPQPERSASCHPPSLSLVTPKSSLPRMSLRFLARLTYSHGLVNSFNCDNNVIQGLIPSGLLQDGSRPSFEPVSISSTLFASPGVPMSQRTLT